jgi:hypothetical protein
MSEDVFGAVLETATTEERRIIPLSKKRRAKLAMQINASVQPIRPEMVQTDYDIGGLLRGAARRAALAEKALDWPGRGGRRIRQRLMDALRVSHIQIQRALNNLEAKVHYDDNLINGAIRTRPARTMPRDILDQIGMIHEHFGNVRVEDQMIVAETGDIVLKGFNFGKFKIRYTFWRDAFSVEAVNPVHNPNHHGIVHPHVDGQSLCLGEGRPAHDRARVQGRIFDMFVISDRILHTYQRITAYRSVSSWRPHHHVCEDCGAEGETHRRCRCNRWLCEGCGTQCVSCHSWVCNRCEPYNKTCRECGRVLCGQCQGSCMTCHSTLCVTCYSNPLHRDTCTACHTINVERHRQLEENVRAATPPRRRPAPRPQEEETRPVVAESLPVEGSDFFGADGLFGSPARLPQESGPSRSQPQSPSLAELARQFGLPSENPFGTQQPVVRGAAEPNPSEESDDDEHDDERYDEPDDEPDDWRHEAVGGFLDDLAQHDAGVRDRGQPGRDEGAIPMEHDAPVVVPDGAIGEPAFGWNLSARQREPEQPQGTVEPNDGEVRADGAAGYAVGGAFGFTSLPVFGSQANTAFPTVFTCSRCDRRDGCQVYASRLAEAGSAQGPRQD